ncbi:aldehyde dehydrogenase family protein, partial [Rhizobium sp. BR 315]
MTVAKLHITTSLAPITVYSPYDGSVLGTIDATDASEINELLARARRGAELSARLPRHERARILEGAARIIESPREAFAETIVREAGKTIVQARKEVLRCVNTLKLSAEEAKRNAGEIVPFDAYV